MKRILLSIIAISIFTTIPTVVLADNAALTAKLYNAVGLLYAQSPQGELRMLCTATAFEQTPTYYSFVTAAHCIGDDDRAKERSVSGDNIPFYITKDEEGNAKTYHRAKVKWAGYQSRGEDFAVFEVQAKGGWDIIPLGDEHKEQVGSAITNIASPLGLGFQVFHGALTTLNLDRPVVDNKGINWKGSMLLDISAGGGSSGSALVSQAHENIVGFLVGSIGGSNVVGIPVSRFKAVLGAIEKKTYKWWAPQANINPDGSVKE